MKFKIFASFVGMDDNIGNGWSDYEIIVHSNSKENARKKTWNWAKMHGAVQRNIQFVSDEIWKRDKCYRTRTIK